MSKTIDELPAKHRRRVLDFADRLSQLAAESPNDDTRQITYRAVNEVRSKYGFRRDEKKAEILRLVKLGASTPGDLINETRFHRDDVFAIIRELETEELVVVKKMQLSGHGRPSLCVFPA